MAANISSSGLALAASNMILDWRKKTQQSYRAQQTQKNQQVQLQQVQQKQNQKLVHGR